MRKILLGLTALSFILISTPSHAEMISAAEKVVGLHERTHRSTLRKMMGVDPARTPWCGYAMAYFARKAGYTPPKGYPRARNWINAGRKVTKAQRGDVVVMRRHVGIFTRYNNGRICLLGGNQGNSVRESCYKRGTVIGIRRLGTGQTKQTKGSYEQFDPLYNSGN
jgi:uncharacterized protein (TIGR02594 family)